MPLPTPPDDLFEFGIVYNVPHAGFMLNTIHFKSPVPYAPGLAYPLAEDLCNSFDNASSALLGACLGTDVRIDGYQAKYLAQPSVTAFYPTIANGSGGGLMDNSAIAANIRLIAASGGAHSGHMYLGGLADVLVAGNAVLLAGVNAINAFVATWLPTLPSIAHASQDWKPQVFARKIPAIYDATAFNLRGKLTALSKRLRPWS